jgi:hypothetical protein
MLVEDTAFARSQLSSAGDTYGGSLSVTFVAEVQEVTNIIRSSNFTDGVLVSDGNIMGRVLGGGAYWGYMKAATNVYTLVTESICQNMSLISQGGWSAGGGFMLSMQSVATYMRTTIEDSTMSDNILQSTSTSLVAVRGGSLYIEHSVLASPVAVVVRRSFMQRNSFTVGNGETGGAGLWMMMNDEATNVTTVVEGRTIGGHTMQSTGMEIRGGSVTLNHNGPASSVAVVVKGSFIQSNSLMVVGSDDMATGAGLCMTMFEEATNVKTVIEDSTIGGHTVQTAGGSIRGGSVYLYHDGPASLVAVLGKGSFMQSNSLMMGAGNKDVDGAGLCLEFYDEATNVTMVIEGSIIGGHTLQSSGDQKGDTTYRSSGGSVAFSCIGDTAGDVLMVFRNSIFEGNRGADFGGALHFEMSTLFPYIGFVRTVFSDCQLRNNTANFLGGAIYHVMSHAGASLELHRWCTLLDNCAGVAGGAINAAQRAANPPANLEMLATDSGPDVTPRWACTAVYDGGGVGGGYAREWEYGVAILFINASTISNNRVDSGIVNANGLPLLPALSLGSGGGMFIQNLNVTVHASEIANNNQVLGEGGAFFLAGGSARLSLEGNTNVTGNTATTEGSTIYSISGGGITLRGTTTVDFVTTAGIIIQSGGRLEHGTNTLMRCPAGERMFYNVSTIPTAFNGWSIDCDQVRSLDNGSQIAFSNPTCVQIQDGPSALFAHACNGLPLLPAMMSSSGTISCSKCPNNQYSPDHGSKQGDDSVRDIRCLECPYGTTCAQGGARIQMRPDFWGMEGFEEEPAPPTPAPTPVPTPAPPHYGNPANGCLSDETTITIDGVPGDFCAPGCTPGTHSSCPTNMPAGVSADPQCAITGAGGTMTCALICDPTASNECGSAQCQPIQGTGICTYTSSINGKMAAHVANEGFEEEPVLLTSLHTVRSSSTGINADQVVNTPVWLAYQCPADYCCTPGPNADSCDIDGDGVSDKLCVGNRDPAQPLCGGCLAGYSQAIDNLNCVPDSTYMWWHSGWRLCLLAVDVLDFIRFLHAPASKVHALAPASSVAACSNSPGSNTHCTKRRRHQRRHLLFSACTGCGALGQ